MSPKRLAVLAPDYFVAVCTAISELAIPLTAIQNRPRTRESGSQSNVQEPSKEDEAFRNVLGLILAGLVCEGSTEVTGMWISMGYRIFLDNCPVVMSDNLQEWQGLFSGLQVRSI